MTKPLPKPVARPAPALKPTPPLTNRHPVDELADIRAKMDALKKREAELRKIILSNGCTLDGHEWEAIIVKQRRQGVSKTMLQSVLTVAQYEACHVTRHVTAIFLNKMED